MTVWPNLLTAVSSTFNKRTKRSKEIAANLLFLRLDLKPSVLWDFCSYDEPRIVKLCEQWIGSEYMILQLASDYFIFKKRAMINHLKTVMQTPPLLLDISGGTAVLCSDSAVQTILGWVAQLKENLETCEGHGVSLYPADTWNLSTMFGILLGYPVVYWFSNLKDENCLSNEDLYVHSVTFNDVTTISFSVPVYCVTPALSNTVAAWSQSVQQAIAALSQLSIEPSQSPTEPNSHLTKNAECFIDGLKVKFSRTVVNMPQVVL